jgi:hypothetical protein
MVAGRTQRRSCSDPEVVKLAVHVEIVVSSFKLARMEALWMNSSYAIYPKR